MNSKVKKNQTEKELDIEKSGISKKATKSKIINQGNSSVATLFWLQHSSSKLEQRKHTMYKRCRVLSRLKLKRSETRDI